MDLTERQKAVIFWAAANDVEDWRKIYILASDKTAKFYEGKNIIPQVSKWKHSHKIQNYYEECRARFARLVRNEAAATIEGETCRGEKEKRMEEGNESPTEGVKTNKKRVINYLDRESLLQELNRTANNINDIKQKTDILKIIADLSRMKDNDKDTAQQIRRFYLPLSCLGCQLYLNAKEKSQQTDETKPK